MMQKLIYEAQLFQNRLLTGVATPIVCAASELSMHCSCDTGALLRPGKRKASHVYIFRLSALMFEVIHVDM